MTNYIARVAQRILLLRYPWGTSHHTYWHTARTHDTDNTPLPHALCLSQNRAHRPRAPSPKALPVLLARPRHHLFSLSHCRTHRVADMKMFTRYEVLQLVTESQTDLEGHQEKTHAKHAWLRKTTYTHACDNTKLLHVGLS